MCVCVHVPSPVCVGVKITNRSWFSVSILWVLGINSAEKAW